MCRLHLDRIKLFDDAVGDLDAAASMHLPPQPRPAEPGKPRADPSPPNFIPGIAPRSGPSFPLAFRRAELVRDVYQQRRASPCLFEAIPGPGLRAAQIALLVGCGAGICFAAQVIRLL